MHIENIGDFTEDKDLEWNIGPFIPMKIFNYEKKKFIFNNYKDDIGKAMCTFLDADNSVLRQAEEYIFQYYTDTDRLMKQYGHPVQLRNKIISKGDVWGNITIGDEVHVKKRRKDGLWYFSIDCSCTWEVEHGLLIVIKESKEIAKVGQFDGHLTNEDAYADPRLANVIYKRH